MSAGTEASQIQSLRRPRPDRNPAPDDHAQAYTATGEKPAAAHAPLAAEDALLRDDVPQGLSGGSCCWDGVRVSYSIYVQRFAHGDAAPMDDELGQALLAPHVVATEFEYGYQRIQASDGGEADVYKSPGSIMFNRFAWGGILEIVAELVARLSAVILLPEGVAILRSADDRAHLPVELAADAVVVDLSGAAIQAVIESV